MPSLLRTVLSQSAGAAPQRLHAPRPSARARPVRALAGRSLAVRHARRAVAAQVSSGDTQNAAEMISSTALLTKELRVLGMPEGQVEMYVLNSQRRPSEDYDNSRSLECLKAVMKGATELEDTEALMVVSEDLRELWLWKRRKGDYFGGDGQEMYEVALSDIQDVDKKAREAAESEKVSSILLDNLDLTDEEKRSMGKTITGIAVGGVQGAIWNAVLLFIVALSLLNFVGRGS